MESLATGRALDQTYVFSEVPAGEGGAVGDEVCRCALEHHPATVMPGSGAEVDDPVGVGHHGLVVLDHNDRRARIHEPVE